MSPEQEAGAPTDHRTDVFSFGCVFYEMLTGTRAFDGTTPSEGEPSLLKIEPDLLKLPRKVSPKIPILITRCMERDPRRRWQALGDVRIELEAIETDPHGLEIPTGTARGEPLWKRAIPLLATAALTGVIVAAVVGERPAPPQPTTRFSFDLAAGQRFTEHGGHIIDVSRDGSRIAVVANDQLMVRDMADGADAAPRQLPVRHWDLSNPRFSPDGRWIMFYAGRKLQKIALSGGAPLMISEMPDLGVPADLFGVSWDRDDDIFLGRGPRGIQRVSANGGDPETVLTVNVGEIAHGPQLLPDGEHVIFTLAADEPGSERWDRAQIVVQSVKSGVRQTLIQNGSDARYLPSSGHIIYAEGSTLRAVPFDAATLQVVGEPASIVDDVRRASEDGATGAAQFGASATGTLAYIPGGVPSTYRSLALIDMKGEARVLHVLPGLNHTPRFSVDGKQITWQGGDGNIWIFDRTGSRAMRPLTFDGRSNAPVWTPDGRIVFQSGRDGGAGLFWQPADGSAPADLLLQTEPGFSDIPTSVSPDGKTLLFLKRSNPVPGDRSKSSERADGIWILPLVGAGTPQRLIGLRPNESRLGAATFSRDGRRIVYKAQPGSDVYVEPFPPTGERHRITSGQNWAPMWAPNSRRLIFLGPQRSHFFAVDILKNGPSFDYGPPRDLFDVKIPVNTFGDGGRIADMSPDGKYIMAFQGGRGPDAAPAPSKIHVVLGWVADLQSRQARVY